VHPAYSVIFFTVSSGLGFGMVMILGALAVLGRLPGDGFFAVGVMAGALAAAAAGLVASSLHLGHPERAWRAFSQWRTSWLSREGVAAVLTFPPALVFAFGWAIQAGNTAPVAWAGAIAALLAFATVLCTGMIYQSLRTIRAWHDPIVTPIYIVLAIASGSLWLAVAARAAGHADPAITHLPFATLLGGWILKALYWGGGAATAAARRWVRRPGLDARAKGCACSNRRTPRTTSSCARWATASPAVTPRSSGAWPRGSLSLHRWRLPRPQHWRAT
jgi:DMSO reductase anchor subunit